MQINLNQKSIEVPTNATVADLLKQIQLEQKKGIAVAVAMEIVPASAWHSFVLKENIDVTIITAAQGG